MKRETEASIYDTIPGGVELLRWFGCVPDFYDAEILDFTLRRNGTSTLNIHYWNMTNQVKDGHFVLEKHAVIHFAFDGIFDLSLKDFNQQNVIEKLRIDRFPDGSLPVPYEVSILPCHGLAGRIRARELTIGYTAGKPQ
ncbi:Imm50 family immunity protein [Parasulfitobacter algicola]|uniref:Uncharacterized protein n=1 Tax=Parasulfitobacter algicola TaxID=2614809 RepID=A0ABX2IRM3_9RHOB|nr:Imm50 family immunity protein [Sulfitobacter algicola]NSX55544.1 hypothetical protein [Sulfitobacter algicola]